MEELEKSIHSLRDSIRNAKEKAQALIAVLENEELPDSALLDEITEILQEAGNIQSGIMLKFSELGQKDNIQKGTVTDYLNYLNAFSTKDEILHLSEALDK